MANLKLTKESTNSEIKEYFTAVLNLSQSNREFPVSIDDVWPLVYGKKSDAVEALINNEQFIKDVDYQVLRKNPQKACFHKKIRKKGEEKLWQRIHVNTPRESPTA